MIFITDIYYIMPLVEELFFISNFNSQESVEWNFTRYLFHGHGFLLQFYQCQANLSIQQVRFLLFHYHEEAFTLVDKSVVSLRTFPHFRPHVRTLWVAVRTPHAELTTNVNAPTIAVYITTDWLTNYARSAIFSDYL